MDANNLRTRSSILNLSSTPRNNQQGNTNQQGNNNQQGKNSNQESMTNQNNKDNHGNFNNNLGNTQTSNLPRPPFFSNRQNFTTLGQSLESSLKELLDNNVITLTPQRYYEPRVKTPSWNDLYYCNYHRCKGHRTNNYQALWNLLQDLIDNSTITIEGHHTNDDHQALKDPLPNYQKGETLDSKAKNINNVEDNIICHIYVDDQRVNVIKIKEKQEYQ